MRNWLSGLALIAMAIAALFIGVNTQSASATVVAPTVSITRVGTDAMGADSTSNRNREYVLFKNTDAVNATNVAGVTVMDSWRKSNIGVAGNCNKYTIGAALPGQLDAMVPAGQSVIVSNGWGVDHKTGNTYWLYAKSVCGLHGHYFNNDSDKIYLMTDATGTTEIDHKFYNWFGGYYVLG